MDDSIKKELKHISTCLLKLTEAVKQMNRANTEKFEAVMLLLEPYIVTEVQDQRDTPKYKWKDWPEEEERSADVQVGLLLGMGFNYETIEAIVKKPEDL